MYSIGNLVPIVQSLLSLGVESVMWNVTSRLSDFQFSIGTLEYLFFLDQKVDKDMLELSFLIVAKRRGTKWSHKNIVHKILLPMIKGEIEVSYTAKRFCITTIGCIMKPYNNDMTVHTEEVVNLLINMFKEESRKYFIIIKKLLIMIVKYIAQAHCISAGLLSTVSIKS